MQPVHVKEQKLDEVDTLRKRLDSLSDQLQVGRADWDAVDIQAKIEAKQLEDERFADVEAQDSRWADSMETALDEPLPQVRAKPTRVPQRNRGARPKSRDRVAQSVPVNERSRVPHGIHRSPNPTFDVDEYEPEILPMAPPSLQFGKQMQPAPSMTTPPPRAPPSLGHPPASMRMPASEGRPPASMRQAPPASMRQAPPASMRQAPPASMRQAPPASMRQAPPSQQLSLDFDAQLQSANSMYHSDSFQYDANV